MSSEAQRGTEIRVETRPQDQTPPLAVDLTSIHTRERRRRRRDLDEKCRRLLVVDFTPWGRHRRRGGGPFKRCAYPVSKRSKTAS
ncbi:hypothetical protein L596_021939 [Steinernema carpocapsae]|uniref:Uncharacterized protein n=1 Tax=Steinernema carpocapsae TaxID=34508 RepID=A0A4U5MK96_STECR|nr:hypothetical protein L596_021939 [Steinernema carpocapsae]